MQEDILRKNGLKVTEGRKTVLKLLSDNHEPMSVDEIFRKTLQQNAIDYSTVYRILTVFTDKNIILKCVGNNGVSYYQINNQSHSHYLVCSHCHKRIAVEGCPLSEISKSLVEKTGFHITGHNLEFIGECPECMDKKEE